MINDNITCENTDKELWRERKGDHYANSIHVTTSNAIGINCGGHVIGAPLKKWHEAGKLVFGIDQSSWRWKLVKWLLKENLQKHQLKD